MIERGNQRRLPDLVKFDDGKTTRVGWLVRLQIDITRHACYGKVRVKRRYDLKMHQTSRIVEKYEAISVDDRARVPATAYSDTNAYFNFIIFQKNETTGSQEADAKH